MKSYTESEVQQHWPTILEQVQKDGPIQIRRRDGHLFLLQTQPIPRSPLDIPGIHLPITTKEIVAWIREGREERDGLTTSPRMFMAPPMQKKEGEGKEGDSFHSQVQGGEEG